MTCPNQGLPLNPGGDYGATVAMTDETGAPIDGTGLTASIVDATGELGSAVTAAVVTANPLTIRLAAVWQPGWALTERTLGTARLALTGGATEHVSRAFAVYVPGPALRLVVPRGSDYAVRFTWPDDRDGADLTGETLDVINASATLAPLVTVAVIDAATRECELRIEGDLSVPTGEAGTFQLRRRVGSSAPRTLAPYAVSFR